VALVIFIVTFLGVALTRLPKVTLDRPVVAFLGAVAMVVTGALTFDAAIAAIDWDTIALLLGMMLVIAGLQRDGYTQALAALCLEHARSPRALLVIVVAVTGIASAFLVNDAVVLVFTPIVVAHCRSRGLNPLPFLLAEAMASNIGGAATITGNPQNVLVGLKSGMSYGAFMFRLLPVAVLSSLALVAATFWLYRKELKAGEIPPTPPSAGSGQALYKGGIASSPLSQRGARGDFLPRGGFPKPSILILALVLAGFLSTRWTGLTVPLVAVAGGGLMLVVARHSPRELFSGVDWLLLVFFGGLFVVIGGIVGHGYLDWAVDAVPITQDLPGLALLHGISLALSQIVSNVPYTVLMLPVLEPQASDLLWLGLASSATLAGNLTLVGAVANLIVAEQARKDGVVITFRQFLRLGLPVTLATLLISLLALWAERLLGWL